MSCLDKFPKSPSPDEVLLHLQRFLGRNSSLPAPSSSSSSAVKGIKGKLKKAAVPEELGMLELTHLGLWLIRHLPVARDAVFQFISSTFDQFVKEYIILHTSNLSTATKEDDVLLDDIRTGLLSLLDGCGEIWAPILSAWSLHLLGQLSKDYANYAPQNNVHETIRFWMGSKAVQSLMEITASCLTCKDHASTEAFISTLIDTSTIHSPRFDWVVAHVGNTYPQMIVSQVLNLGFHHFSTNSPVASVKLNSVRGILEHLVTPHGKEVQLAFDQAIQQGLTDNNSKMIILYVMTMCSNSMPLLDVLMDTILPRVNEETLSKLRSIVPKWVQVHFGGREVAAVALVTHLIMKSSRGPKALEILMRGCKTWQNPIGLFARTLLDHFIAEASSMFYESDSPKGIWLATNFPAFPAMKEQAGLVINFLTDPDPQISRAAKQFVKILSMYDGAAVGVKAICHYLKEAEENRHLWHLVDLVAMLEMKYTDLLGQALQLLVIRTNTKEDGEGKEESLRKWQNILKLLKAEKELKTKLPLKGKLSSVLSDNLDILAPLLDVRKLGFSMKEGSLLLEILTRIGDVSSSVSFGTKLSLERQLVQYFFRLLSAGEEERGRKVRDTSHIIRLLFQLGSDAAVQNDALRSLIQFALYPESRRLFMGRVEVGRGGTGYSAFEFDCLDQEEEENESGGGDRFSIYVSLMDENQRRSAVMNFAGAASHAATFHSGKLMKNGVVRSSQQQPKVRIVENEDAGLNWDMYLAVLVNLCMSVPVQGSELYEATMREKDRGQVVSVEAMRKVALLLVEIVSPDVMFNGLPWPEEDFSRVQVERDLQIRRAFEDQAYLWDLLELVAFHSPSLCYCSVLLRALTATLMAHWTSCQEAPSRKSPTQLAWTIRLLQIMKTGELLPPPLCFIGQVIHELRSHEVLGLLRDVWNYMRLNVPVPTIFMKEPNSARFVRNPEFSKVDPAFTEKLRLAILNNIDKLGYLYPKLFPNS